MKLNYRPDIDGLRAIAVLAVLLFHTNTPGFSGGFVGVDIFFVISGFLITSIILNDIEKEQFSLARFYERRIRRIFPALFPVIAFTLVVGAYLFDAGAFKHLGQSISATTLFFSNILFLRESGYFDAPSLQKPLLHTWSLAVEEQFYIFFPLALLLIHRYLKSNYLLWIGITLMLSLAASIWKVHHNPVATFYLIPTRTWELLVGSVLAVGVLPNPSSSWLRNMLSVIGLGLIIYSVGFYTEATLFPGHNAIAPVLGAGLIIYAHKESDTTIINKLLAAPPLVFIGLISYSLYLWHWPFVAFMKYLMFRPFNIYERLSIIILSFVVATLSWKFIEQPFRNKKIVVSNKKIFAFSATTILLTATIGQFIYIQRGMAWRYPEANATIQKCIDDPYVQKSKLFSENEMVIEDFINNKKRPDVIGKEDVVPSFILWGDSHAQALIPAISNQANRFKLCGFVTTKGKGCPPTLGIDNCNTPFNEGRFNDGVIAFIKKNPNIHTVILAARWPLYNKDVKLKDLYSNKSEMSNSELLINGLQRTINTLLAMNCKIIILSDVPELSDNVLRYFWLKNTIYKNSNIFFPTQSTTQYYNRNNGIYQLLTKGFASKNITVLFPEKLLFDKHGQSIIMHNGKLLYRDKDHLSQYGAYYIAPIFDEVFKEMAAK
uniref:Putative membrane-located cell surface saccharide saccharide acetylase protein n=1 Tax=Chlorobium chlorochromatii (strain CaD3) TaxID=340177 RepID=Q3AR49_CHLCH